MVKYYYDKYNLITNVKYTVPPFGAAVPSRGAINWYHKDYRWDDVKGIFITDGERYGDGIIILKGTKGYRAFSGGSYMEMYDLTDVDAYTHNESANYNNYTAYAKDKGTNTTYSQGSLIQSNIVAENGTYPTNGHHTDGYWYVRRAIVNQNPVITANTPPSGTISVKPSFNYNVSDPDGNPMTVTESIDGVVFNTRTGVTSGSQFTFTPTDLAWLRTRIKQTVNVTITADDGKGGVTTVNYPVTRSTPAIDLQLKTPFETDVAAKRLLLKLEGSIPGDAVVNVQACNNSFDASPTWENATNLVLSGFPYPFNNTAKTAAKWGVSFKIRIERGSSTQSIYLDGVGGAFD